MSDSGERAERYNMVAIGGNQMRSQDVIAVVSGLIAATGVAYEDTFRAIDRLVNMPESPPQGVYADPEHPRNAILAAYGQMLIDAYGVQPPEAPPQPGVPS